MDGAARARKGRRARLTREERSEMRILSAHGLSGLQISQQLKRSSTAVYRVLSGQIGDGDCGNDYDFVSKEFKEQYAPLKKLSKRLKRDDDGMQSLSTSGGKQMEQRSSVSTSASRSMVKLPSSSSKEVDGSKYSSGPDYTARPVASSSRQRTDSEIDLDADIKPDNEKKPNVMPTIDEFLRNLDHDLSIIKGALEEQDLGTIEKLLAIAHWPDTELHGLVKEALPMLTVAQRYMLVKGMKKYDVV